MSGTGTGGNADAAAVERASRGLLEATVRALEGMETALNPTQVRALLALDRLAAGCSNTQLADDLGVFPSSASRTVDRLAAAGLVRRTTPPSSRREVRVALTAAGRRAARAISTLRAAAISETLQAMSPAHRAALLSGLEAFDAAYQDVSGRTP